MKKNVLLLLAVLSYLTAAIVSCNGSEPVPEPDQNNPEQLDSLGQNQEPADSVDQGEKEPVELQKLTMTFEESDQDRIFERKPKFNLRLENPNDTVVTASITIKLYTDKGESVKVLENNVDVPAKGTENAEITTDEDLAPGFYKIHCAVKTPMKKIPFTVASFNFGVAPEQIVSAPDMQPDFESYWDAAKNMLPEIKEGETVTLQEIELKSGSRKVYLVELQSVPNGLTGDPVIVRGFYVEPQDGQKHPVLMHFFGWDDRNGSVTVPSGGSSEYAEFYLSTRGQYHNNRPAAYEKTEQWIAEHGEWKAADPCKYASILDASDEYNWFGFNFGDKDSFYYRGAFLDCVQAIRFMATRPTSDMTNLFAEGSSQGGALSYAAAALSDFPFTAIAANVAFLGDYPDYFDIVSWPGNVAKDNQGSMTDEQMYAFLSYYDTKNLATLIPATCAVLASSGLQDGTCPPHTNFAAYNNLKTKDKEMVIGPKMQHSYPDGWSSKMNNFFRHRMK